MPSVCPKDTKATVPGAAPAAVATEHAQIHRNAWMDTIVNSHPAVLLEHAHHIRIVQTGAQIAIRPLGPPIR